MKLKQVGYSLLTFCAVFTSVLPAQAANFTTIADGLNNPGGITFSPDGSLYVTETGIGGDGICQLSVIDPSLCAGQTGAIVKVDLGRGTQTRVIDNFDSLALRPTLEQGRGPQEIAFDSQGDAYLVTGYGIYPGDRDVKIFELAQDIEPNLPPSKTSLRLRLKILTSY